MNINKNRGLRLSFLSVYWKIYRDGRNIGYLEG